MAGNRFTANSGSVATSTTPKSVIQVKAAANVAVLVHKLTLVGNAAFGGTDSPADVRLTRVASGGAFGTWTGSITLAKDDPARAETLQATASYNATGEPTSTATGKAVKVNPETGYSRVFDPPLIIPGGASLQVEITAAAVTPSFQTELECEE